MVRWAFVVFVVGACASKQQTPAPAEVEPVPIRFGDCAATTVAFVSGPRPLPFTAADAEITWIAKTVEPPATTPSDQPPSDDESSGPLVTVSVGDPPAERARGRNKTKRDTAAGEAQQRMISGHILGSSSYTTTAYNVFDVVDVSDGFGFGPSREQTRRPGPNRPTVSLGAPITTANLDKQIVRESLERSLESMTICTKPGLVGTISTSFVISSSGAVTRSSATGVDPDVASCIAIVISAIEFPPHRSRAAEVRYPIILQPPEPARVNASSDAPRPPPPPLFRSREQGFIDATAYAPGAANPLRAERAALAACLRTSTTPTGVAVVELSYAGGGTVDKVVVHGIVDAATRSCIAEAARRVKRDGVAAERCSLAFGEQPIGELPALELTENRATLVGGTTKLDAEVQTQRESTPEIAVAIASRVDAAITPPRPVVTTYGPLVLRAPAATKMKFVDAAIRSVIAGGDDFVLAVQDGQGWSLLSPMALPVVPVPYRTGGRWNHRSGAYPPARPGNDNERVVLAVLVDKDDVYVGLSSGDRKRIPILDAATELGPLLKKHKAHPALVNRADLEIAGDGEAMYGAFAQAVRDAVAAGFSEWQHLPPDGLGVDFLR